jgi:hypothetical protein
MSESNLPASLEFPNRASRYDARLSPPDEKSAHRLSAQRAVDCRDRLVDHAIGALAIGLIYLLTQVIAFLQPILVPFAVAGCWPTCWNPAWNGWSGAA